MNTRKPSARPPPPTVTEYRRDGRQSPESFPRHPPLLTVFSPVAPESVVSPFALIAPFSALTSASYQSRQCSFALPCMS